MLLYEISDLKGKRNIMSSQVYLRSLNKGVILTFWYFKILT